MFMPLDKFEQEYTVQKSILRSKQIKVDQCVINKNNKVACLIRIQCKSEVSFKDIQTKIKQYSNLPQNPFFNLHYWSLDVAYEKYTSIYEFHLLTDTFKEPLYKSLQKAQKVYPSIDQMEHYITYLVNCLAFWETQDIQLSPINSENIYYNEGHFLVYIPFSLFQNLGSYKKEYDVQRTKVNSLHISSKYDQSFISKMDPMKEISRVVKDRVHFEPLKKEQTERVRVGSLHRVSVHTQRNNFTNNSTSNQRNNYTNNQRTNASTHRSPQLFIHNPKCLKSPIKPKKINTNSTLPSQIQSVGNSFHRNSSAHYEYLPEQNIQNRIKNLGVFIFEIASQNFIHNLDYDSSSKFLEKEFSKHFLQFLQTLIAGNAFSSFTKIQQYIQKRPVFMIQQDIQEHIQKVQTENQHRNLKALGIDVHGQKVHIQDMGTNMSQTIFLYHFIQETKQLIICYFSPLLNPFYQSVKLEKKVPKFCSTFTKYTSEKNEIYILGGKQSLNFSQYLEDQNTFVPFTKLTGKYERYHFTIVALDDSNFLLVSGIEDENITAKCEIFSYQFKEFARVSDCLFPTIQCSLCNYNGNKVYKFGGQNRKNQLEQNIEIFDINTHRWDKVTLMSNNGCKLGKSLVSIVINPVQILLLGGVDQQGKPQDQTCFLNLLEKSKDSYVYELLQGKPLKSIESFYPINQNYLYNRKGLFILEQSNRNKDLLLACIYDYKNLKIKKKINID